MISRIMTVLRRAFIAVSIAAFALAGYGCGGGSSSSPSLGAQFTASTTPAAARLVKLVQKSASGTRIVVQAVIYGPDTTLDMYSFAFDVKIGNTTFVKFADGTGTAGNALTAFAGQTVQAIVGTDVSDASHVVVGVSKLGGGLGNGVAGSSAVIVEMAFDVLQAGTTTLTISASTGGSPLPPTAKDSTGATIGTITFDAASASMMGISTGGGGGY
jgi:hypothetical protein